MTTAAADMAVAAMAANRADARGKVTRSIFHEVASGANQIRDRSAVRRGGLGHFLRAVALAGQRQAEQHHGPAHWPGWA